MTKTGIKIENVVKGDEFRVQRTYTGLPVGLTITKAWFTVKRTKQLPDAEALFPPKEITQILTPNGHIIDPVTDDGNLGMYFDLFKTDTEAAWPNVPYRFDVQVLVSTGAVHTLEEGTIHFIRGVTDVHA